MTIDKDRAVLLSIMTQSIVVNRDLETLLKTEKLYECLGHIDFDGHSWAIGIMKGYDPSMSILKRVPNDGEIHIRNNMLPEKTSFESLIKHRLPKLDVFRSHFGDAEVDMSTATFHWIPPRFFKNGYHVGGAHFAEGF